MGVQDFLHGAHKKHLSLKKAVESIAGRDGCTIKDAGAAIQRLLSGNQFVLYTNTNGEYSEFRYEHLFDIDFVDEGYFALKKTITGELDALQRTGQFADNTQLSVVYFKIKQFEDVLKTNGLLTPPKQNALEKYRLIPVFDTQDAAMIINNCP